MPDAHVLEHLEIISYFFNQWMNESISISRTAHPPLKNIKFYVEHFPTCIGLKQNDEVNSEKFGSSM